MRRVGMPFVAALSIAAGAAGAGCSSSDSPANAAGGGPPPASVGVETVGDSRLTTGWTFLGRVQPAMSAEIAAAVQGHVLKVTVREGDSVTTRQVLVALDSSGVRAQLDAAKARLASIEPELKHAERQLARVGKLDFPTISVPEKERFQLDVDSKRAALAVQQAEVKRLEVELSHHTLRAPFDGVVRSRQVDPGDWVGIGRTVIELVTLDDPEIHVDVSSEIGQQLAVGKQATLVGATRQPADIAGIVPALDDTTRTMRVRLTPQQRPAWLIAGMAVDVEFEVELAGQGVTVSRDALIRGPVDTRVIKVVDGAGVPITVDVIATSGNRSLVRGDGLASGDVVVVRGNERLRPGQPLNVVD